MVWEARSSAEQARVELENMRPMFHAAFMEIDAISTGRRLGPGAHSNPCVLKCGGGTDAHSRQPCNKRCASA